MHASAATIAIWWQFARIFSTLTNANVRPDFLCVTGSSREHHFLRDVCARAIFRMRRPTKRSPVAIAKSVSFLSWRMQIRVFDA